MPDPWLRTSTCAPACRQGVCCWPALLQDLAEQRPTHHSRDSSCPLLMLPAGAARAGSLPGESSTQHWAVRSMASDAAVLQLSTLHSRDLSCPGCCQQRESVQHSKA